MNEKGYELWKRIVGEHLDKPFSLGARRYPGKPR
jgi:hypothetical protein